MEVASEDQLIRSLYLIVQRPFDKLLEERVPIYGDKKSFKRRLFQEFIERTCVPHASNVTLSPSSIIWACDKGIL